MCTRPNLEKYFHLVASKYDMYHYNNMLKINIDETPLLVKRPKPSTVIVNEENSIEPVVPRIDFIFKCTAVLVVAADGTFMCAAVIFPQQYDMSIAKFHYRQNFRIYQSSRGSVTKEIFENFVTEEVISRIGVSLRVVLLFYCL